MKHRVALWGLVGFAVAVAWALIASTISPNFRSWNHTTWWTLAAITCPVAVLGKFVALKVYTVIAINALTYAAVGLVVELLRLSHSRIARHNPPASISS